MINRTNVDGSGCSKGFTLIELLVALFLMALGVMAMAPMFMVAVQESAVSADLGFVGAEANERMELLRAERWRDLTPGGSLASDEAGYSDLSDPDFIVRWIIEDNVTPADSKTISVRAIATRQVVGQRKQVVLTTLRSKG